MDYSPTIRSNKPAQARWDKLPDNLRLRLAQCQLVVLDFDGVMTDNKVYVAADGTEFVRCDKSDFFGMKELEKQGVAFLILSTEPNGAVLARAEKLAVPARNNLNDKAAALHEEALTRKISLEQTLYVGNDLNDWHCLGLVGIPVAVADTYPPVRELVRRRHGYITEASGGNGAVREVLELLLLARVPAK